MAFVMMRRDKKDEEDGGNPFKNIEKATVVQEARTFNDQHINTRKCCMILTKLLYLINQGEILATVEATETFFAMTKLFQSKDVTLRRMVYLTIKEMSKLAEDVIIVTSSLTKDMNSKEDLFRASAVRALCMITDGSMLQGIERYLKQAIVDRDRSVASAALVSSLHLSRENFEIVKRWVNEVQQATSSDDHMVQYHALGLLYQIKKNDKLAITKLVSKQARHSLRSPFAHCLMIRIASKIIEDDEDSKGSSLYDYLESCLRHKSEMVVYEAARAIVNLKSVQSKDLSPAVSGIVIEQVAITHPLSVTTCNLDLENLVTDSNRNIATLAITTLLKTGSEASIERLMKQITSFMSEISDEFKTVVVDAIKALCLKFPRKHLTMMNFLSAMLRDEGGYQYKKAIVNTIISIIEENKDAAESGLGHLCEFIEDCEHTSIAVRVLHLLGKEGPKTLSPSKYIRYIYNRVILENSPVRAASICALAKLGAQVPSLKESIVTLLSRCMTDSDDEVRDRATFCVKILQENSLNVSVFGLERALMHYVKTDMVEPFNLKSVPVANTRTESKADVPNVTTIQKSATATASKQDLLAEQLARIPQFASLGPLFKSSDKPIEVTESETEYVVRCVKHIFQKHIVFQFDCTNTLEDQLLENAYVEIEPSDEFEVESTVPVATLAFNVPGTTYTCVSVPEDMDLMTGSFVNTLKFVVKDCDVNTGEADEEGYEDEYVLEDVEVYPADYMQRVLKSNFAASWEELDSEHQSEETYVLSSISTIEDAVKEVTDLLGMQPCERSDKVARDKNSHTLLLAGVYVSGDDVLARARFAMAQGQITMLLTARSQNETPLALVHKAVG
ncbi:uncharacterized protein TRIADDRAFT_55337 [Trichoplax adhaerens]|uniref:Coatomer subunit gamma n=1 Tax=Trichoplax adhaerens TaxID=10228 RepID=B3RUL7_TRIAD|nr:hypothetical protein TRIADDRAFT_55337 [Trichoplax adhaerens]EDV25841.1 hypothetical protein TRIADDRAFT_55337 [Trichoplax adhaerens]|eukprot:XP_002111874.1 hypothetical protein TRIADDRAFT_55337 [Trichoplax adhaerens]